MGQMDVLLKVRDVGMAEAGCVNHKKLMWKGHC